MTRHSSTLSALVPEVPTMDSSTIDRRKWTPEEDALLTEAMGHFQLCQEVKWTEVAAFIPGRTAKACRKRWVNGLNERLRKGSWTEEEDNRLREGVKLLANDWARIAEHVGQRSGDQCSKRWREVLDPCINKSQWTEEEDKLLTDLFYKFGSSWQVISTYFDNRRALQCRNRCCKLLGLHAQSRVKKPAKKNVLPAGMSSFSLRSSPSLKKMNQNNFSLPSPIFEVNPSPADLDIMSASQVSSPIGDVFPVPNQFQNQNMNLESPTKLKNGIINVAPKFVFDEVPFNTSESEVNTNDMTHNPNQEAVNFLDAWNKVQGFSSVERKGPPAMLNLALEDTFNPAVPSPQDAQFFSALPSPQDQTLYSALPSPQDQTLYSALPSPQDRPLYSALPSPQDNSLYSAVTSPPDCTPFFGPTSTESPALSCSPATPLVTDVNQLQSNILSNCCTENDTKTLMALQHMHNVTANPCVDVPGNMNLQPAPQNYADHLLNGIAFSDAGLPTECESVQSGVGKPLRNESSVWMPDVPLQSHPTNLATCWTNPNVCV